MRRILFAVLAVLVVCPTLMAQATRTWVSGVGDDVNPCSRTAPCKTFAGAISKTAAGGEIDALDPGGFGAVTITKSITIDGGGTFASILAPLTNAVNINANAADKIVLRNLSLNGAMSSAVGQNGVPTGLRGINYIQAGQVTLENVTIQGFNVAGVFANLTTSGKLIMNNVTITECVAGVQLTTSAGQLLATMNRSSITNNSGIGYSVANTGTGSARATILRSLISHNGSDGVKTVSTASQINVDDSTLVFNAGTAVNASAAGSTIRLSNNVVNNNNAAFNVVGSIFSTGDNRVDGNAGGAPPALPAYVVR